MHPEERPWRRGLWSCQAVSQTSSVWTRGELGLGAAMARGQVLEEDELGCHLKGGGWEIITKDLAGW